MRRRHTRATDANLAGTTTQRAVRLPDVQLSEVQAAIAKGLPDIHSVTDAVVDALWLWLYEHKRSNGWMPPAAQSDPSIPPVNTTPEQEATAASIPFDPAEQVFVQPEPTEADRAFTGHQERPKWADVDLAVLDGDG